MGSKGLNGKTVAWCVFRKEVVISGEEMEQNTLRWEKPSFLRILRIILAISIGFCKEEVTVTAFSQRVICLRHVQTAAAKSWGRSLPAMLTMAWLRATRGSPPPVLHRQTSARSWLVRAFCMEIRLSSQDILPRVQSHWLWKLAWVGVCKVGSTNSMVGFGYILICLGKGGLILFNLLFKFLFALGRMRVLLYSSEKNANRWGVCFLQTEYLVA